MYVCTGARTHGSVHLHSTFGDPCTPVMDMGGLAPDYRLPSRPQVIFLSVARPPKIRELVTGATGAPRGGGLRPVWFWTRP